MFKDIRIRNANRSTPIPRGCRAFVFYDVYDDQVKVIISDSVERALIRFKFFCYDQGIDYTKGWRLTPFEDDFEVVLSDNLLPRK